MKDNELIKGMNALFGVEPMAAPATSEMRRDDDYLSASTALKEDAVERDAKSRNVSNKKPRNKGRKISRNKEIKKPRNFKGNGQKTAGSFEAVNLELRLEYREKLRYLAFRKDAYLYELLDEALKDYFRREDIAELLEKI